MGHPAERNRFWTQPKNERKRQGAQEQETTEGVDGNPFKKVIWLGPGHTNFLASKLLAGVWSELHEGEGETKGLVETKGEVKRKKMEKGLGEILGIKTKSKPEALTETASSAALQEGVKTHVVERMEEAVVAGEEYNLTAEGIVGGLRDRMTEMVEQEESGIAPEEQGKVLPFARKGESAVTPDIPAPAATRRA
jgi:hypothetical protein